MGLHAAQTRQFESAPWVPQRSCGCDKSECSCEGNKALRSAPPIVEDVLRSSGQPLDAATRAYMEPRFGHNFSNVRVHTNAEAAQSINAWAFTVGQDVVFDAGRYRPDTEAGRRLLAHELTHTIQQSSTTSASEGLPTMEAGSQPEREADAAATNVGMGMRPAIAARSLSAPVIQRDG